MVVFKRRPKFHPLPKQEYPLVPSEEKDKYPSLKNDFETLDQILVPAFRELDKDAMRQQNYYRWTYVVLIFVGSLATICGIVQIAFQNTDVPGIVEAVIAAILFVGTAISRSFKNKEYYFNSRLAAEQLRSTYFLFLGRQHPFEDEHTRVAQLQEQVDSIQWGAIH